MRTLYKRIQSPFLMWVLAVLVFAGLFEYLPVIEKARAYVSLAHYQNPDVSCRTLLADRPWYGRMNHWFFAWIVLVPVSIFSMSPQVKAWKRGIRTVFAILVCYVLMNLAVHLQWDIRNAPFGQAPYDPEPANGWRMDCVNTADGFSLVFSLVLGWIPACVYTGICLCFWRYYHTFITGKITGAYKGDIVTRVLFVILIPYAAVTVAFVIAIELLKAGVIDTLPMPLMYYFTLRPLLVPFEIFVY